MSRYIDAEALTAEFHRLTLGENSLIERFFADGVYAVIDTFPTADVAPVVHARWYYHYRLKKFVCLNCGFEQRRKPNFKFCPQCSAKMDEEAKK